MSFRAKRELLVQVAPRYRAARHAERSAILDEFIAVTGHDRKYAIRVLLGPIQPPAPIRRPRRAYYGREVQDALASAWLAANGICAKRLVPFLVELIPTLERLIRLVTPSPLARWHLTGLAAGAETGHFCSRDGCPTVPRPLRRGILRGCLSKFFAPLPWPSPSAPASCWPLTGFN